MNITRDANTAMWSWDCGTVEAVAFICMYGDLELFKLVEFGECANFPVLYISLDSAIKAFEAKHKQENSND